MHTSLQYLHVSKLPYIGSLLVNMVGAWLNSEFDYITHKHAQIEFVCTYLIKKIKITNTHLCAWTAGIDFTGLRIPSHLLHG